MSIYEAVVSLGSRLCNEINSSNDSVKKNLILGLNVWSDLPESSKSLNACNTRFLAASLKKKNA